MDGYEKLAKAIIEQAVKDYKSAYKKIIRNPGDIEAIRQKREIEDFFYSDLFEALTDINPQVLMKKIIDSVKRE